MELFPIMDSEGNVIGRASRSECHSGTFLLHPVIHLHLIDSSGRLYLQKRSFTKDIQPGKWDTSVGGHVDYGEEIEDALYREAKEELGITSLHPVFLHRYVFTSEVESELVHSYYALCEQTPQPDPIEIDHGRFWTIDEIQSALGTGIFTPNFEDEFQRIVCEGLLPIVKH
jgi:isopentenyldiphosphate isomerase